MNLHTPSKALILTLLAASAALAEDAKVAAPAPAEQPAAAPSAAVAPAPAYTDAQLLEEFGWYIGKRTGLSELGLNAKELPPHARLKPQPPGSMCNATTRIASLEAVDAELRGWLKQAYDAAG